MSDAAVPSAPITELKASAHLMRLDPGVFCVFNSPGTAAPDPSTGLPGVRISAAPAPGGNGGVVTLSGLDGDGWIGGADGAALVRISGGPAQVLVTVYQGANSAQEAPKLQVLRLTEAAQPQTPPAQEAAPEPAAAAPIEVGAHIYGRGDVAGRLGEWMGERGSKRWVEGFGLQPASNVPPADIEYQAVLGRGWLSPWSAGGQFCGSRGMSLPILGLRVRLRGASAERYSVAVAATFVDGTEIGPVGDGEACEAPSLAALEAFVVAIQPKAAAATAPRGREPAKPAAAPAPAPAPKTRAGTRAAAAPAARAASAPAAKAAAAPVAKGKAVAAPVGRGAKPAPIAKAPVQPAGKTRKR